MQSYGDLRKCMLIYVLVPCYFTADGAGLPTYPGPVWRATPLRERG